MRTLPAVGLLTLLAVGAACTKPQPNRELLGWSELARLPDPIGFAGPFAGVSSDALLVAGGANFPGGRPWDGHPKVWHDRVFVLENDATEWQIAPQRLPRPLAYGVALTWGNAVVCLGGGDAQRHYADAFLLRWDRGRAAFEDLPALPAPAAFFCGALVDDTVYVAGGLSEPRATRALHTFWALDLTRAPAERRWQELEPWPGPERHLAVAAAQDGSFFLFGGIQLSADTSGAPVRISPYLSDAYRFTPRPGGGTWKRIAELPRPLAAAPTPALPLGPAHVVVLGGDDGNAAGADARDQHQGFPSKSLAYHTITDTWTPAGNLPKRLGPDPARDPNAGTWPPVTTPTVVWNDRFVVPSGEVRPGVRTPRVLVATPIEQPSAFGAIDYAVLVLYLLSLVAMGFYFSKREKGTDDFFLGGRRVPFWAAGISIFGTQLSAITFMAVPAKTYATDWVYFLMTMGIVAMAPVVVFLYLPFFRRLNVTTAYEYLEHRFDVGIRLLGSASFVVFQLGRMAVVVFLPALALSAVTGMPTEACIVIMGVLCTLYTVLGGIEAVIWTDVIQVFVLMGGALIALVTIAANVDGGLSGMFAAAEGAEKLKLVELDWDWTGPALGVILLGAVFNNLVPYTTDQAVVQRYLTTRDEKQAAGAVWTGALLAIPASLLFFAIGTALWAFYRAHPQDLNPLGQTDQIFAWFIVQELPAGISGLLIAGIFAAAMSSLDSSMNSIATAVTTDFFRRFRPEVEDRVCLALARWITVILGVLGTAAALFMAQFDIGSLWDQFLGILGLLGGTLGGLFALGIFSRRASAAGAWIGASASFTILAWVKFGTDISNLAYAGIGVISCALVGWIASVFLPHRGSIQGLTIRTLGARQ